MCATCTVFTIVDEEDEAAIDRIYDKERSVIRSHRDLQFDFNVIARHGRPVSSLLSLDPPGFCVDWAITVLSGIFNSYRRLKDLRRAARYDVADFPPEKLALAKEKLAGIKTHLGFD